MRTFSPGHRLERDAPALLAAARRHLGLDAAALADQARLTSASEARLRPPAGWRELPGRLAACPRPDVLEMPVSHGGSYRFDDLPARWVRAGLLLCARTVLGGACVFNDPKLRLVGLGGEHVELSSTDYLTHLVTTSAAGRDVWCAGERLLAGGEQLPDGADGGSVCADSLGGQVLLVCPGPQLVLARQPDWAAHAPGAWMAAAAGSFDVGDADAGGAATLSDICAASMARELAEEVGLPPSALTGLHAAGLVRDLARGAKPDVFGLAGCRLPAGELSGGDAAELTTVSLPSGNVDAGRAMAALAARDHQLHPTLRAGLDLCGEALACGRLALPPLG
jgi:hypothetical protein